MLQPPQKCMQIPVESVTAPRQQTGVSPKHKVSQVRQPAVYAALCNGSSTLVGGVLVRFRGGEARLRGESPRLRPRGGLGERLLRRGGVSLRGSLRRTGEAGLQHTDNAEC